MPLSSSPVACHGVDGRQGRTRPISETAVGFKGVSEVANGNRGCTSRRYLSHEVAKCLDDVDFGVPKLKDLEGLPQPLSAGKLILRRSEVKDQRKRWNGEKTQFCPRTGASEVLCGALRTEQPNVAMIVTRSQTAKQFQSQAGHRPSVHEKRSRR
mmetsp:Transcript_58819/g.120336  ORF Transcript_58819/g.120336 Transcript_58819/m.120336 type:complete len:155 (+) Transcript_58819:334-798(+)